MPPSTPLGAPLPSMHSALPANIHMRLGLDYRGYRWSPVYMLESLRTEEDMMENGPDDMFSRIEGFCRQQAAPLQGRFRRPFYPLAMFADRSYITPAAEGGFRMVLAFQVHDEDRWRMEGLWRDGGLRPLDISRFRDWVHPMCPCPFKPTATTRMFVCSQCLAKEPQDDRWCRILRMPSRLTALRHQLLHLDPYLSQQLSHTLSGTANGHCLIPPLWILCLYSQ